MSTTVAIILKSKFELDDDTVEFMGHMDLIKY